MHLWSHVTQPLNIGVIGTGETAAAIVVALVEALGSSAFIEVISPSLLRASWTHSGATS